NQVAVIDTRTRSLVGRYALPGCDGPTGIAYAGGADVIISACAHKVDQGRAAADGAALGTLAIGAGPDSAFYDPARRLAFIPCGRSGELEGIVVRGPKDDTVAQPL